MSSQFTSYLAKYNFVSSNIISDSIGFATWPIRVKPLVDNQLNDAHWHASTQIWYTISGEYEHMINGVRCKQLPGSVSIILPYSVHQIDSRKSNLNELNVISVSLPQSVFTSENIPFLAHTYTRSSFGFLPLSSFIRLSGDDKKAADRLFEDILSEFRKHYAMDPKKIYSNVSSFFEICSKQTSDTISKKEIINARQKFECVDVAMSYIIDNFASSISLDSISREAMMSQRSFTSAFTEIVGQTCHNYIMLTRMNKAVFLLKRTSKSLDEIADECGFCDRTHFIRLFKNSFGTTPTAWRDDFLKFKQQYEEYVIMAERREYEWLGQ